jgi:hypothetical protein
MEVMLRGENFCTLSKIGVFCLSNHYDQRYCRVKNGKANV